MTFPEFQERYQSDKNRIEEALQNVFQNRTPHGDLYDAMNYSLLAGGKRLRPVLLLESCRMCGGEPEKVLPFAYAIEMIHTYSLIHDDLPCMDDDEIRRGRPTNHKVYGEAVAVLAGDALLTAAFESVFSATEIPAERALAAGRCLAEAAGAAGMVGGQILDMAGEGQTLSLTALEELQSLKTGALLRAAAEMGCILAGGGSEARAALRQYADKLGRAFQVRDDILDVTGNETALGKTVGSDGRSEKATFVSVKGLTACQELVESLTEEAVAALAAFSGSEFLIALARQMANRDH